MAPADEDEAMQVEEEEEKETTGRRSRSSRKRPATAAGKRKRPAKRCTSVEEGEKENQDDTNEDEDDEEQQDMEEEDQSEESSDSEEEDEEVTRTLGAKGKAKHHQVINAPGKPAEAGVIVKIYCENFMCHRKLSINLCSNVNFINGQNGSGKSAILAALQICLGARASVTHRGTKLSDMIRQGHEGHAIVRVSLLNKGSDAFEHAKYGDYITVERRIERHTSGCGYRLLRGDPHAADQKHLQLVSKKKEDLDRMLDLFNIQIENPCALLDQENAKKFIAGDAGEKFKFFERATDIDRVQIQLREGKEKVAEALATLVHQQEQLPVLKAAAKEAEKKVEEMQSLEVKEKELKHLKVQLAWAHWKDEEDKVEAAQGEVTKLERQMVKIQQKLEEAKEARRAQQEDSSALEEKVAELKAQIKDAKATADGVKKEIAQKKQPIAKLEASVKSKVDEIKRYLQKKKDTQAELKEEAKKLEEQSDADIAPRIKRKNELEATRQAAGERREAVEQAMKETKDQEKGARDEFDNARNQLRGAEGRVRSLESQLKGLTESGGGNAAVYGQPVARALREIEKNKRRFKEPPIGPIGMHVKVKQGKEEWAAAAENAIGNILHHFIVTSHEDRHTLMNILKSVGAQFCTVYTVAKNVRRHRIREPQNKNGFEMVLDCITVENDLVYNVLVDFARADGSALLRSHADACKLARNSRYPDPIKTAYDKNDMQTEFKANGAMTYRPSGRGPDRQRLLGKDMSAVRAELQRSLAQAKEEVKLCEQHLRAVENQAKAIRKKYLDLQQEEEKLGREIRKLNTKHRELTDEITEATDAKATTVDLGEFERQIEGYEEQIRELTASKEEAQAQVARLTAELKPLLDTQKNEDSRNKTLGKQLADVQSKIDDRLEDINNADREVKKYSDGLGKVQRMERDVRKALADAEKAAAKKREETEKYTRGELGDEWDGSDVEVKHETKVLVKQIEKKRASLEASRKAQKTSDSLAVMQEKYERAKQHYLQMKQKMDTVATNVEKLKIGLEKRKDKLRLLRRFTVRRATQAFDNVLQHKGQSGHLGFDIKNRDLNISVQKDNKDETTTSRNVKELSGGERSYTTLALLIALGESIECPFRVMDEFDIFMDAVARKTALDLLIQTATGADMQHRQFIFITPQDLSYVQGRVSNTFKIHKLRPPERTSQGLQQTTLT